LFRAPVTSSRLSKHSEFMQLSKTLVWKENPRPLKALLSETEGVCPRLMG